MDLMDRDFLVAAMRQRDDAEADGAMESAWYWQGRIDSHLDQNAIEVDELPGLGRLTFAAV